jgi:ribosomal protein S18 acetylase RimI-like enzyme
MDSDLREASGADRPALERTLAAAFMDDPVAMWATPREALRQRTLRRFFGALLAAKLPDGFVYTDRERTGVALWARPDAWRTTAMQGLRIATAFADPRQWARGPLVTRGLLRAERLHPPAPSHFYLATLGVAPDAQGNGLGSRLLAPVLEICDADGVPAYLESSKESNISFYARHGFRVTREIALPRGPTIYAMWRAPLSARMNDMVRNHT